MAETRRGRPPLPVEERKSAVLKVRMTDAERQLMESAASRAGVQLSVYVRRVVLAAIQGESGGDS